jgi:hypothetical protein
LREVEDVPRRTLTESTVFQRTGIDGCGYQRAIQIACVGGYVEGVHANTVAGSTRALSAVQSVVDSTAIQVTSLCRCIPSEVGRRRAAALVDCAGHARSRL